MSLHKKFLSLVEKYELTPENILLVFFSFWLTVIAVRGSIFWLVYHSYIPAIFVRGYHIHHFVFGFVLFCAALILFSKEIFSDYIPLTLFGSSLALIFDEFLYWTRGHFNYWSIINLVATVSIGACLLLAHLLAKRGQIGRISKKRIISFSFVTIIFALCLYTMFRFDHLVNTSPLTLGQDWGDGMEK